MILELFATAGLEVALARALEAIADYRERNAMERLLAVLHEEFGDRAGLGLSDFDRWQGDAPVAAALQTVLDGDESLLDEGALADQIRRYVAPEDLASEIADAAVELAPLALHELPQATYYLRNQGIANTEFLADHSDDNTAQILRAIEDAIRPTAQGPQRLSDALILGPLNLVGAQETVERAEQLSESEPREAARLLEEVSDLLAGRGIEALAETYAARAAQLHAESGALERAVELFQRAALGQVNRASSLAGITIRSFHRTLPADQKWRADALEATLNWIGDPEGARVALEKAVTEDGDNPSWLAALADLYVLLEDWEALLALLSADGSDDPGLALRINLGRAEALAATGHPGADATWKSLLTEADQLDVEYQGLSWARWALRLALDDRPAEARDAYRAAMARWSKRAAEFGDELAECFYSGLAAETNAGLKTTAIDLMPLAAELRGSVMTPAARADSRQLQAMRQRLSDRLREAFFSLSSALRIARLSGSLSGLLAATEAMAELMESAGRPAVALGEYARAGRGKEVERLARDLRSAEVEPVLTLGGPGWVRVAEYGAVKVLGTEVSEDWVARKLPRMIEDAHGPPPSALGPNPRLAARTAISGVALQIPEPSRPEVYELLSEEAWAAMPEGRQQAGRALAMGTNIGLWDATELVVACYLHEPQLSGVDEGWVAQRAGEDADAFERLCEEAEHGSRPALRAVCLVEDAAKDPKLVEKATHELRKLGTLGGVERSERQVSISINDLSSLGLYARLAEEREVRALTEKLVQVSEDEDELEGTRASAVHAIYNALSVLPADQFESVSERLAPLAQGQYEPSPWDEDEADPLAFMRIQLHTPHSLQAAALVTLGRAVEQRGAEVPGLELWISEAVAASDPTLVVAGLEAAAYVPAAADSATVIQKLGWDEVKVRRTAVGTLIDRGEVGGDFLERVLNDSSGAVRAVLLQIEAPHELRDEVRSRLREDPDAYLRAMASQ